MPKKKNMKFGQEALDRVVAKLTQGLLLEHYIRQMKTECIVRCVQRSMPFKKRNSDEDYFDAVEALGKGILFQRA